MQAIAFSPNSSTLASAGADGKVILWDVATRKMRGTQPITTSDIDWMWAIAFSPDGKLLAAGGRSANGGGAIRLWDVQDIDHPKPLDPLLVQDISNEIRTLTFNQDGSLLVSGDIQKQIAIWDVPNRKFIGTFQGNPFLPSSIVFSPNGKILASASCGQNNGGTCIQGEINLFDIIDHLSPTSDRKMVRVAHLVGHTDEVTRIAFSSDSQTLASSGRDSTVILWDVASGKQIGSPLRGHRGVVWSVAFSPDGKTLASGSRDQTVILWSLDPAVWKARACETVNRNMTQEEWEQFNGVGAPYERICPTLPFGDGVQASP